MTRLFAGTPFNIPPTCDRCGLLESACKCPPLPPPRIPPDKQTARIKLEKRQKSKLVTVVSGLPEIGNDLPELLTHLKTVCGAGGTLKDEQLEIQGDHVARVRDALTKRGFRVKI
ncbi:MAG: translation initiation factor [Pirellulales bacterium]